ncbi:putative lipid II flippase FtsW [Desulfoplanes formicivorans]|uniref:Probable peptidoglycan glycosyltransferase FtsW n=1 Tax=Desulfoplanes formicivorans TaxID=1592317 RepID=A0A194AFF4_9BACT|nr:putative lipid II flippase FtsW [Desulfoplanes formicivorans]GAU07821.1 cell division protein FtsW [Desulfoplanes formicivorans]
MGNSSHTATRLGIDWWLLFPLAVLTGLGLIMVLSASGVMAEKFWNTPYHFITRQSLFAGLGLCIMLATSRLSPSCLHALHYPLLAGSLVLLALTLLPVVAVKAGGASRWINLGFFSLQPLEVAKVALVFYLAYFFSRKQDRIKTFRIGFVPPFMTTGIMCALLLVQPDFGGAMFLVMILFLFCLVGGTRFSYLAISSIMALGLATVLVMTSPYRFRRWFAFLDPFKDAQDSGYQLVQSLYGFGAGGWLGVGLGAGRQKLFFLPEAHNDFILAVLGEELGFVGVSLVIVLMGIILWRCVVIALNQKDMQDRFLAFGAGLIIILGAILNMAVVLAVAPPKGVAFPFLSYGGSNMLTSFFCMGILLNLSRRGSRAR